MNFFSFFFLNLEVRTNQKRLKCLYVIYWNSHSAEYLNRTTNMCKERREGGGGGGRPVGSNGVKLGARFSLPHGSIFPSLTLSKAGYLHAQYNYHQ